MLSAGLDLQWDRRGFILLLTSLLLLLALIYLPLLDQPQLTNEEPRRVLVAQSMLASGDYWVPVVQDQIYIAKPPLYNWMLVLASWPSGVLDSFNSRIGSVISLALLVAGMLLGFRRLLDAHGLTFLGFALVLAPELANKALIAEIEALFTLLVSLSLWCWFWLDQRGVKGLRLWLPSALLVGLAFLAKREPALVFYYLGIGGYLLFSRRLKELFQWPHLVAATLTLAMIGFWLWKMISAVGYDSFIDNTLNEVVARGTGAGLGDILLNALRYPFHVLLATLPFSLLLLPLVNRQIRQGVSAKYPEIFKFALIVVLINLPLYQFRGDLSVRYFMPMMPSLLVLAALVYDWLMSEATPRTSAWLKGITRLVLGLTLALALCVNLLLFPEQLGIAEKPDDLLPTPLVYLLSAGALLGAILLLKPAWQQSRRFALPTLIAMMLVLRVLYFDIILPHKAAKLRISEDFAGLAATIHASVPAGALPVRTYGPIPNPLWYHMGYGNLMTSKKAAADGLGPAEYLVGYRRVVDELKADGMPLDEIAFIPFEEGDVVFARVIGE